MFMNLKAEMARKEILMKDIAIKLNLTPKTLSNKVCGKTEFTCKEMHSIKKLFFPNCTLDYLFSQKENEEQKGA